MTKRKLLEQIKYMMEIWTDGKYPDGSPMPPGQRLKMFRILYENIISGIEADIAAEDTLIETLGSMLAGRVKVEFKPEGGGDQP